MWAGVRRAKSENALFFLVFDTEQILAHAHTQRDDIRRFYFLFSSQYDL